VKKISEKKKLAIETIPIDASVDLPYGNPVAELRLATYSAR